MDNKGQCQCDCDACTAQIVTDLKSIPILGECLGVFGVNVPIGPLGVISVVLTSIATNTISFLMSPVVLSVLGVSIVSLVAYKSR
jgi:hypothetical protein